MSSRPSNFHPNIFSIGSMRLYVVHPVSLWNGTSSSPGLRLSAAAAGEGACAFSSASHGQTSPRGTPPNEVRSCGQIGARPETRTCQRAARGTRRLGPSAMDSDSRKSVAALSRVRCARDRGRVADAWTLTYHVARSPLSSKKRRVALEGVAQVDQERSATVEADHWVLRAYLHGLCCLLSGYLFQPLCFR